MVANKEGTTMIDLAANTFDVLEGWINMKAVYQRDILGRREELYEIGLPLNISAYHHAPGFNDSQRMKKARSFLLVVPELAGR